MGITIADHFAAHQETSCVAGLSALGADIRDVGRAISDDLRSDLILPGFAGTGIRIGETKSAVRDLHGAPASEAIYNDGRSHC